MISLGNFNSLLVIAAYELAAEHEEITALHRFSKINVPEEYIQLISQANQIEVKVANEMYIRIWGPKVCVEMNEAYDIQNYLTESLAIGDDEGGGALLYLDGLQGFGVYLCRFADLDVNEAVFISPSLEDLLVKGIGIEQLLQ